MSMSMSMSTEGLLSWAWLRRKWVRARNAAWTMVMAARSRPMREKRMLIVTSGGRVRRRMEADDGVDWKGCGRGEVREREDKAERVRMRIEMGGAWKSFWAVAMFLGSKRLALEVLCRFDAMQGSAGHIVIAVFLDEERLLERKYSGAGFMNRSWRSQHGPDKELCGSMSK
jgi:hypothetical protein